MEEIINALKHEFPDFEIRSFSTAEAAAQTYKKSLPINNFRPDIPKENAWICWLCDDNGLIIDMQVYELDPNDPIKWKKIVECVQFNTLLCGNSLKDCGRVVSDWNEWTLIDLLFKFGWQYGFVDRKTMILCIKRISTIIEFKEDLKKYLSYVE